MLRLLPSSFLAQFCAAPADYRTVHSSRGRLRVHLARWSGKGTETIVARLRQLAGVTHAEANAVTGNVLILFNARQTSPEALISALPAIPFDAIDRSSVRASSRTVAKKFPAAPVQVSLRNGHTEASRPVRYVTGARRVIYRLAGWSMVGLAIVGVILPGIPFEPFVVLAGYFFIRSSPAAHQWLRETRLLGPVLRDWEEHHAVRRSLKYSALILVCVGVIMVTFMGLPLPVLVTAYSFQLIFVILVLRLRVIDSPTPALIAIPV